VNLVFLTTKGIQAKIIISFCLNYDEPYGKRALGQSFIKIISDKSNSVFASTASVLSIHLCISFHSSTELEHDRCTIIRLYNVNFYKEIIIITLILLIII